MPSRACLGRHTGRSSALARAKARTASIFGPCRRRSWSSGVSGQRMPRPSGGMGKSAGRVMPIRMGSTSTTALDSTTSVVALRPTQHPEKRERANPISPRSRCSCTFAGFSTGIMAAAMICSLWCGRVEDWQPWSSPMTARTPPRADVPAALACLNTSAERSTPGPLPYQMPNTPSTVRSGSSATCCVPQRDVAARSSLRPGWKRTSAASRNRDARESASS